MIRAGYFMQDAKVFHSPKLIRDPHVSIILPTYCRGDNGLLARSINSVLSQSFSSFELIVMDDGSTDGTADLVSGYVRSDDRVMHVRHDMNCGLPALRVNEALMMARGELCAYQFDDDQWTNTYLETITAALLRRPEFEVAYGLCKITVPGAMLMPGRPFDYSRLMEENYIANNSIVHRKSIFGRLGGYDMHLVMRRRCDWDLWLRWGRHAPFLFVEDAVTLVEARLPRSIGNTCVADNFAMRSHMALDRDARLRPEVLQSYVVDDLDHLDHLGKRKVDSIWRQQVGPYFSRFRHIWKSLQPPKARPLHVLVSKGAYDSTLSITLGNFAACLANDFLFTFVPEAQTDETAIRCADILLLHRTSDEQAVRLAEMARQHGKAVVFLMDDDLISLHEVAAEFSWLAPGAPRRLALESVIRTADLVITYSPLTQESVNDLNPRHVLLDTNIQRKWLSGAQAKLDQLTAVADPQAIVRIGFAGGAARREELAFLWPAIVEASRRLGARAEFHFWGFAPEGREELQSPCRCEPFTFSYEQYMGCLTATNFDVMIAPLFDQKRAKRAKCPIKFLEITAAGAVGVYSDVEPYRAVIDGVSGIKCANTVEAWTAGILQAASLAPVERKRMLRQALEKVERDFISENQAPRVAATLEAAHLHGLLDRASAGKPRIAYFCHSPYLSGVGNRLLGYARVAVPFQFEPLLVLPRGVGTGAEIMQQNAAAMGISVAYLPLTVETELDAARKLDESMIAETERWLRENRIGMVHSFNLMREVGQAAGHLGIPHVASLYETYSRQYAAVRHCDAIHSDSLFYADCWAEVLDAPAARIMPHVAHEYFNLAGPPAADAPLIVGLFGSLQPRKGQLQAIEAVGLLKQQSEAAIQLRLFGYDHFDPNYVAACHQMAARYGVSELITFAGFTTDAAAAMRSVHVLLCASDGASMPRAIPEAMAAGRLVIAPGIGGIPDVVCNATGIPMPDNTPASILNAFMKVLSLTAGEWRDKTGRAREVAREECSTYAVATELFRLYSQAAAAHPRTLELPGIIDSKTTAQAAPANEIGTAHPAMSPSGGLFERLIRRSRAKS